MIISTAKFLCVSLLEIACMVKHQGNKLMPESWGVLFEWVGDNWKITSISSGTHVLQRQHRVSTALYLALQGLVAPRV